eukprot:CAMPEP_0197030222 /NCGR_PEP_ID=MMETSP1384-20130603/9495_1 /TAXON_ID=29189 /ORGANISM="Ammonia sp." /LENGTH=432 /DNA_ID=CAMNT_0042459523 /DNA_START=9 /DNA_END=1304 /DNA_ORIENTATION=+
MALKLTAFTRQIKLDDTHQVDTNCDFSKTVYIGGNIEKYGDSFPDWMHEIVSADITNKHGHQEEYFKFMALGKSKRNEFIRFIRSVEIPKAMIHVNTDKRLTESGNVAFVTTDEQLKHLSLDEEAALGLNIKVTGKAMLYNNDWREKMEYVRSTKSSNYGYCHHWRRRIQVYTTMSTVFGGLLVAWSVLYLYHIISTELDHCGVSCAMTFTGLLLMALTLITKLVLIYVMFVMDAIEVDKWKYLWMCSASSVIAVIFYIVGVALKDLAVFQKSADDEVYIIGTILWLCVMDIFVVLRRNKAMIYFGWIVAFSMIYIASSILFLVFGDDSRERYGFDYALVVLFPIAFLSYAQVWFCADTEIENGVISCCVGLGVLAGIFAIPMISIWHFGSTDWTQDIPLFMEVFRVIKSAQLLSISGLYVLLFFGRCCKIW